MFLRISSLPCYWVMWDMPSTNATPHLQAKTIAGDHMPVLFSEQEYFVLK